MARLRDDGAVALDSGELTYGDDPIRIENLRELAELLAIKKINYTGLTTHQGGFIQGSGRNINGAQGSQGAGAQGAAGNAGFRGPQGTDPGPQGPQGVQGGQGFQGGGTDGPRGFQGFVGTLQGPQGFVGLGRQGPQGNQGFQDLFGNFGRIGNQGVNPALTFPLLAPDGSAAAPSYSFSGGTDTGMYRDASGILGFAILSGAARRATLTASQFRGSNPFIDGRFAFLSASGNGMRFAGSAILSFLVGGGDRVQLNTSIADGETVLLVAKNVSGVETIPRVTMGAADSGGVGFKLLNVPNT